MCLRGKARGVIRHKDEWRTVSYQELVVGLRPLEAMFSGRVSDPAVNCKRERQQGKLRQEKSLHNRLRPSLP